MIKTFYCFRHGQTDWNKIGRIQGREADLSLNEEGKKQALEIPHFPIDIIYSSPLKRSLETAEIYNNKHNVEIIKNDGLAEVSLGDWSGKTWDDVKIKHGNLFKGELFYRLFPAHKNIVDDFRKTLKEIAEESRFDKIGVFTHGFLLYLVLNEFSSAEEIRSYTIKNAECLKFSYNTETKELSLEEK